jgi:CHASE2 domain-containing sensor protein
MTLEEILAAEIERLEKNYGFRNRFVLIGLSDNGVVEMCTTPMTRTSREVILKRALTLP